MTVPADRFEVICEVATPRRPDLTPLRRQVRALAPVASAFLAPDNHLGRAAVSSLAVAHEVRQLGGHSIVCLNSRDRNLLGLRRDLLTAAVHDVRRVLCVRGDDPSAGARASALTVAQMIAEIRCYGTGPEFAACPPFTAGVVAGLGRLPAWKRDADFIITQVSFSSGALLRWRDSADVPCPVYAGIMVLHSPRIAAALPGVEVPASLAERAGVDPAAGLDHACEQIAAVAEHGGFAGVHLIALSRHADVADRLSRVLAGRQPAAR